jgi:ABC-type phosphate transport system substrate-binding protein
VRLLAVTAATLTALCAALLAPARAVSAAPFVAISGAGSTWAANAIDDWVTSVEPLGMAVNYAGVGSTTGRTEFKSGAVDWAASEIPYGVPDGANVDPPPTRGYAYIPDVAGGTALMYNLTIGGQRVTNLRLSGAVIAGIFTNQITMWNDQKVAADNPGLTLPAIPIVPVVHSDGSGDTWEFTQWMSATQSSSWTAYCALVGRSPCTPTSVYPIQAGTAMIGQPGDQGVAGYVPQADGAIGYTSYASALRTGFPVAKVLNAAGYYTAPTAGNVGVSLLNAQINTDTTSPLYLTEDLSQVYTDTDPRTYELSYYSYMILPTDTSFGFTTNKGNTLGAFGQYLLCQGQQQVDQLGYSALPINLVEAGFAQLQKIPGASVPTTTSAILASCNNPTFSPDGTNTLANTDPMPAACDQQGPMQCTTVVAGSSGTIPMTVTVPATGAFTLTVDTTDTVTLTQSGNTATAATTPIVVSDTRNTFPGWSVSGQATDLTGSGTAAGSVISGNQLGWVPTETSLGTGVVLGGTVAPAAPGLGATAAVLALAHAGSGTGTSTLGATLTLAIPAVARAGDYTAALTMTAVTALP